MGDIDEQSHTYASASSMILLRTKSHAVEWGDIRCIYNAIGIKDGDTLRQYIT